MSPSSCEYGWSAPGRADFASAKLDAGVEASGPHDFAVRNSIVRVRACNRSRVGPRPATTIARRRCRVHRIPCPTSVTIAKRPLCVGRDGGSSKDASTSKGSGIFFATGLDSMTADLPAGRKIRCCANFVCSGATPSVCYAGAHRRCELRCAIAHRRIHNHDRQYGFRIAVSQLPE